MSEGEDPELRVVRSRSTSGSPGGRKVVVGAVIAGVVLLGAGVVVALGGGSEPPAAEVAEVRSEVTIAPTSTVPPTTEPVPDGPVAPLTGVQYFAEDNEFLARPALVAKVDNDPKALPQRGLEQADVVVELRVEGISRFMAIFHSRPVAEVAPIRSARTSDPDLLAMLANPLFAWSGGNPATVNQVRDVPWVRNVDADSMQRVYSRSSDRRAPHNLVLDATAVYEAAEPTDTPPTALFAYRPDGQDPGGTDVAGFDLHVGMSHAGFAWSDERAGWLRWTNGTAHTDPGGTQLAATNVVVLETDYVASAADERSPEAVTLGSGRAWVFTGGRLIEATWSREDRHQPWTLLDAAGQPVLLSPGSTWVELPERGTQPSLLAPG